MKLEVNLDNSEIENALRALANGLNLSVEATTAHIVEHALHDNATKLSELRMHIADAIDKGGSYSDDDVELAILSALQSQ